LITRRERSFGSFRRAFPLPAEVDAAKIAATFKDGVMTIDLPTSKTARTKAKKITIARGKWLQAYSVGSETRAAPDRGGPDFSGVFKCCRGGA
jgi:hypothetical protein